MQSGNPMPKSYQPNEQAKCLLRRRVPIRDRSAEFDRECAGGPMRRVGCSSRALHPLRGEVA